MFSARYLNALQLTMGFAILISGCAKQPKPVATDITKMQGEWAMVAGTVDGMQLPGFMTQNFKRVCNGDELTVTNGPQLIMQSKITIDQSKIPRTIDYEVNDGPTKGRRHMGIYEFDGDLLKSNFGDPDSPRPTDFISTPGDRRTLTIWKKTSEPTEKSNR